MKLKKSNLTLTYQFNFCIKLIHQSNVNNGIYNCRKTKVSLN